MVTVMPMKDMRITQAEAQDFYCPSPLDGPLYPPGLCLYLCSDELEKLGMSYDDFCNGDIVHIHALAMVTSKSCSERQGGDPQERVELQITHLAGESEDEENEEAEKSTKSVTSRLYRK